MNYLTKALLGGLALASAAVVTAQAQVIDALSVTSIANSNWAVFNFLSPASSGDDPSFQDISGNDITYEFTLSASGRFFITDGYWDGDQFDVTINGVDKGPTSTPANDGKFVGADWSVAVGDPSYSSAEYTLGPGSYDITGVVIASPYGSGTGAVVLTGIPEPATWATILLGFATIGMSVRRRRISAPAEHRTA